MTECGPCGKFFTSTKMFDKHRVGEHWPVCTRRCLETFEMESLGMVERDGVWGMAMSESEKERLVRFKASARGSNAMQGVTQG
jgi:hypothetical protein